MGGSHLCNDLLSWTFEGRLRYQAPMLFVMPAGVPSGKMEVMKAKAGSQPAFMSGKMLQVARIFHGPPLRRSEACWQAEGWARGELATSSSLLDDVSQAHACIASHNRLQAGTAVGMRDALGSIHFASQALKRVQSFSRCYVLFVETPSRPGVCEPYVLDGVDPGWPSQV